MPIHSGIHHTNDDQNTEDEQAILWLKDTFVPPTHDLNDKFGPVTWQQEEDDKTYDLASLYEAKLSNAKLYGPAGRMVAKVEACTIYRPRKLMTPWNLGIPDRIGAALRNSKA